MPSPAYDYQFLNDLHQRKRAHLEKDSPEPRHTHGFFLPRILEQWSELDIVKRAVRILSRFGVSTVLVSAETIGWKEYINFLNDTQRAGVAKAGKALREEFNIAGDSILESRIVSAIGAAGCGFERHQMIEFSDTRSEGAGDWCGMVQAAQEMGMDDKMADYPVWCDAYDNFEVQVTNPDAWYTHTHCLGRGDSHCRFVVKPFPEDEAKGETYYDTLRRHIDEERVKLEETSPDPSSSQGFGKPRAFEKFSPEEVFKRAVDIWTAICVSSIVATVKKTGWEKLINLMIEKQAPGFTEVAEQEKETIGIQGNDLRAAARMFSVCMAGCGYDDHQFIKYSEEQVEGFARSCPLVEAAERMGMGDDITEISHVCDSVHTANIQAVNPNARAIFTHCLGRGDKHCRFVIDEIE